MTTFQRSHRNAASSVQLNPRSLLGLLAFSLLILYLFVYLHLFSKSLNQPQNTAPPTPSSFSASRPSHPLPTTSTAIQAIANKSYPLVSSYDNGISACLLVMDDNHFLIEWIAFHYHSLPLQYLVLAVDPRSKTSPSSVLNRWRKNANITIVQWNDRDFMSDTEQQEAEAYVKHYFGGPNKVGPALVKHRARQRLFYYKCMLHLKEHKRDWALLTDSDEFVYLNYPTIERLGRTNVPPITQPGSVLTFLKSELHRPATAPGLVSNLTTPCVQIPRIRFGAMESTQAEVYSNLPSSVVSSSGLDPLQFQTLRWRKHAHPDDYGYNRISKVLIDLSRVPWDELKPVDSIHRPIRSMCGHRRLHIRKSQQVLVINHYLGTLEQYTFRDDSRLGNERSIQQYNKVKQIQSQTDDDIRPWLGGLVNQHGHKIATELLKDVGVVPRPKSSMIHAAQYLEIGLTRKH
ncbi:hypothetical protein ACA910_005879 [Epithemia clementina (nom. ined.)]